MSIAEHHAAYERKKNLLKNCDQCQSPTEYRLISTEGLKKAPSWEPKSLQMLLLLAKILITTPVLPKMSKSPIWGRYCIFCKSLPSNSNNFWRKEKILWFDCGSQIFKFCHLFFAIFLYLRFCFPIIKQK